MSDVKFALAATCCSCLKPWKSLFVQTDLITAFWPVRKNNISFQKRAGSGGRCKAAIHLAAIKYLKDLSIPKGLFMKRILLEAQIQEHKNTQHFISHFTKLFEKKAFFDLNNKYTYKCRNRVHAHTHSQAQNTQNSFSIISNPTLPSIVALVMAEDFNFWEFWPNNCDPGRPFTTPGSHFKARGEELEWPCCSISIEAIAPPPTLLFFLVKFSLGSEKISGKKMLFEIENFLIWL